jgi:hypothetical protein
LYTAEQVLHAMRQFVAEHPDRRPLKLPPVA